MATHKSAEKRARQAEKRRRRNHAVKSHTKSQVKAFRGSLASGDSERVQSELRRAESALRSAASKGVIPKRRASRLVSRLARSAARQSRP